MLQNVVQYNIPTLARISMPKTRLFGKEVARDTVKPPNPIPISSTVTTLLSSSILG